MNCVKSAFGIRPQPVIITNKTFHSSQFQWNINVRRHTCSVINILYTFTRMVMIHTISFMWSGIVEWTLLKSRLPTQTSVTNRSAWHSQEQPETFFSDFAVLGKRDILMRFTTSANISSPLWILWPLLKRSRPISSDTQYEPSLTLVKPTRIGRRRKGFEMPQWNWGKI